MAAVGNGASSAGEVGDDSAIGRTETPMVSRISKYHDHAATGTASADSSGSGSGGSGAEGHEGVGLAAGMSFTINFVMGSGFLAIPWGMEQAGVGTGIVLLLLATSALYMTCTMLLDAIARTDAVERRQLMIAGVLRAMDSMQEETSLEVASGASRPAEEGGAASASSFASAASRSQAVVTPEAVRAAGGVPSHVLDTALRPPQGKITLTWRKYELPELVGMYFGSTVQLVYTCLACLYIYGALWSYASLFGLAVTAHVQLPGIDDPEWSYRIFTASFGALVICISMFDIKEQVSFQMAMTGMRILIVSVMVLTVAMSMAGSDPVADFGEDGVPWAERTGRAAPMGNLNDTTAKGAEKFTADYFFFGTTGFTFRGVARLLPIVVYSQLFHTGLPTLTEPLADKSNAHNVFKYSYITTASFYCLASSILALYFGSAIEDSANVNWARYEGRGIRAAMGYLVVFFPAFDVSSVFPINAVALSSNLLSAVFGERSTKVERDDRATVIVFRLLASVPPVVGACLSHNLAQILDYSGVVGLLIATVIPPLLWEASLRRSARVFGEEGSEERSGGAWCCCLSDKVKIRCAQALCGSWGQVAASDSGDFHAMPSEAGGQARPSGCESACNCIRMACDEQAGSARGVQAGPLVVGEERLLRQDAPEGQGGGAGRYQGVVADSPRQQGGLDATGTRAPLRRRRNGCVRWMFGNSAEQSLGWVPLEPASERNSSGEACCVQLLWAVGLGLSAKHSDNRKVVVKGSHRRSSSTSSQGTDGKSLLGDSSNGLAGAGALRDTGSGRGQDEDGVEDDNEDSLSVARHSGSIADGASVAGVELETEGAGSNHANGSSQLGEPDDVLEWIPLAKPLRGRMAAPPGANPLEAAVPRAFTEASRVMPPDQLPETPYGGWWSSIICARLLLLVGIVLCTFSVLALGGLFGNESSSDGPEIDHDDDAASGPGTGRRLGLAVSTYAMSRMDQPWL